MQHGPGGFWTPPSTRDLCSSSRGVRWIWREPAHLWERRQRESHQPAQGEIRLQDGGDDRRRSHWPGGVSPCCEFPPPPLLRSLQAATPPVSVALVLSWLKCRLSFQRMENTSVFYFTCRKNNQNEMMHLINWQVFYLRKEPILLVTKQLWSSTTGVK